MQINSSIYRTLYFAENNEQATTFDTYVERTFYGTEWATGITVCAMTRGLNKRVRVISSANDDHMKPMAYVQSFNAGVVSDDAVTVAYNSASSHYVGVVTDENDGQCSSEMSIATPAVFVDAGYPSQVYTHITDCDPSTHVTPNVHITVIDSDSVIDSVIHFINK